MLLDGGGGSGRGPLKQEGPVEAAMKRPAAKAPAPKSPVSRFQQMQSDILGSGSSSSPKPAAAPASPRTANEILGVPAHVDQPDPLSYLKREEITPEGYGSGLRAGTLHPEQQKMFEAKQAEDDRAEREKVLGISTGALSTTPDMLKEAVDRLTPEEYNALSARQRAAVDFNTMLATAVKKDLRRQDTKYADVGEQQKATYDKSVEKMFGENGSDLYAPETMAVLRQLKISDPTDDLDDYLNLKVAITEDDLKNITEKQPVPNYVIEGRAPQEDRGKLAVVEGLVDKTQQLQESLAKGRQMLQSFQATAASERAEDLGFLGGSSPLASRPSLGYQPAKFTESGAPADLNTYFRRAFEDLSNEKNPDREKVLDALQVDLHPDELQAFMDYATTRARNSRQYGASMGEDPSGEYARPKEIRALLGLDKKEG